MRNQILSLVESLKPYDAVETTHRDFALKWISSGAGLFRIAKPATPNPHLVSYFLLFDPSTGKVLLVDHKKACLWLPSGGHVENEEDPRATVEREVLEELGVAADFLFSEPLFITVTETGGLTPGHVDVSLWYVLVGNSADSLVFDSEEFVDVRWFRPEEIPFGRSDPHLQRFLAKLSAVMSSDLTKSKETITRS